MVAWTLVALAAGWVAVRLLGLERGFPLVQLMAFTPFAAVAAVAVIGVAALLRQRLAALVAAVLALALVVVVAPRALGGPDDREGPRLRVLSVNMHFGTGSPEALAALARRMRADVVSVQELRDGLESELEAAGFPPARVLEPPESPRIGLFSREPLDPRDVVRHRDRIIAVSARLGDVEIVAVHPSAPIRATSDWRDDLRGLPAATPDGPLRVLAGDFNATLDHAELRRLLDTGYVDAADEVGAGLRGTWPHGRRLPPPVTIDHVLADSRIGVREFSVHAIPGTDHRAVFAELVLP